MACQAVHSWTLSGLIGAFLDLTIAYLLLCCSTVAFFISNTLDFFGFSLPCPCDGLFGKPDPDDCLQKLLVDSPKNKVSSVQVSIRSKFPFDSIWERNEDCLLNFRVVREKKLESGVIELVGEASCSSASADRRSPGPAAIDLNWNNEGLAAKEGRFDAKGKGAARRQRGYLRRRRVKLTPSFSHDNVISGASLPKYGNNDITVENSVSVESHDAMESPHLMEFDRKSWRSSQSNGLVDTNTYMDKDMVRLGSQSDTGRQLLHDGHLDSKIRILEQALEEERAARAALFFDLEKERTAAATAADEAMAMISRLQEEKAAVELESRQYERILEEKSTYDAEEMDILKEIIVRREREKHFLENELESYKKMLHESEELNNEKNASDFASTSVENELVPTVDIPETADQGDDRYYSIDPTNFHSARSRESMLLVGEAEDNSVTEMNDKDDAKSHGPHCGDLNPKEEILHDLHVTDDKCMIQENDSGTLTMHEDGSQAVGKNDALSSEHLQAQQSDEYSCCATAGSNDMEQDDDTMEIFSTLPPLRGSSNENRASDLRRHSMPAVDYERRKLNSEVGWLRERLKSIQASREKLNFSFENKDKGDTQLLLLEDITSLFQEIQQLKEAQKSTRRTSLPPSGSKVKSKKRRCRSASVGVDQSS